MSKTSAAGEKSLVLSLEFVSGEGANWEAKNSAILLGSMASLPPQEKGPPPQRPGPRRPPQPLRWLPGW